jgi:hypothetical protein
MSLAIRGSDWDDGCMGDKSPKSKERGQKQKSHAKNEGAAAAKSKQAGYSHVQAAAPRKGRP